MNLEAELLSEVRTFREELQALREEVKAGHYMMGMPHSLDTLAVSEMLGCATRTVNYMLADGRLERAGDSGRVLTASVWAWLKGKGIGSVDFKQRMEAILR